MGMLDSLRKLLHGGAAEAGSGDPAATPAAPPPVLALLRTELGRLEAAGRGLGEAAYRYVATGEGGEVLLRIPSAREPAKALLLSSTRGYPHRYTTSTQRRELFAVRRRGDGAILHRLGEVYAAAWSAAARGGDRWWAHVPDRLLWLELLLREALELGNVYETPVKGARKVLAAGDLEDALVAAGESPEELTRAILWHDPDFYGHFERQYVERVAGLGEMFARHETATLEALAQPEAKRRAHVARLLRLTDAPLAGALRGRLEALWTGPAKTVREMVEALLTRDETTTEVSLLALERLVASGDPGERLQAVLALGRLAPSRAAQALVPRRDVEPSSRVRSEIERILGIAPAVAAPGAVSAPSESEPAAEPKLPAPRSYPPVTALPEGFAEGLVAACERFNRRADAEATRYWDLTDPRWRSGKRGLAPQVDPARARELARALASESDAGRSLLEVEQLRFNNLLLEEVGELLARLPLSLPGLLRLGHLLGLAGNAATPRHPWMRRANDAFVGWIRDYVAQREPDLGLHDLAAACAAGRVASGWIEELYLDSAWGATWNPLGISPAGIWPFFASRTEGIYAALGIRASPRFEAPGFFGPEMRRRGYAVLATFPLPPRELAGYVWEAALGTSKVERPLAQACLSGWPDVAGPVTGALGDGRKDVRAAAADWLSRLRDPAAIKPLEKALAVERHDEARAAMMGALESLGVDVDQFLNRKKLLAEAEKGLAKPLPEELAWFPFDTLPEVHWEKSRQVVPPAILRWLVVQAYRVKSPEPGALLRRYCLLMREDERRRLGDHVLQAWLRQDTAPKNDHDAAVKLTEQQLQQLRQLAKQYPQYYKDFDEATVRKRTLDHFLHECVGSAIGSKGVLAVAAACCGAEAVAPVRRYLDQWYGQRLHQCKALVQMLSWIEHPLAVQLVLAVATRFRTRSIQQEAAACVERIAERRGWTRDELADRTIPAAGFDSDGSQVIDYGQRTFVARLEDDFSVSLHTAAGKPIKALPEANQSEDAAAVKALKKGLTAHKKELAQVLAMQRERLYEAMCVEREWRFEDWDLYLLQHPIVGRYCQRLVWLADGAAGGRVAFRPLPDRTLSDSADGTVELEPDSRVRVAHASQLAAEEVAAWRRHLEDYAVEPLFAQLNDTWSPTPAQLAASGIDEFAGHLVNTFKLRSRATRLGYTRGAGEDGGWFRIYTKSYATLGLQAVLEFTGNSLPEESRTAALVQAYFVRQRAEARDDSSWSHKPVKLATVPAILLGETRGDLAAIAAEGSGFDPDWQKKTSW
jgi:HEAT repeat protein